jgi:hypothetical protein
MAMGGMLVTPMNLLLAGVVAMVLACVVVCRFCLSVHLVPPLGTVDRCAQKRNGQPRA